MTAKALDAAKIAALKLLTIEPTTIADAAALAFIVLGIAIIVIAGWRFVQTAKDVESNNEIANPGERQALGTAARGWLLTVTGKSLGCSSGDHLGDHLTSVNWSNSL